MKRYPVKPSIDKSVFRGSASRTKAINVGTRFMRGGIRL